VKRTVSKFEKEWAVDNRGRKLPLPLVDGDYQSSYYFGLLEEFERALKARIPLTLGMALLCAIEQAGRDVLRFKHPDRNDFQNRECFDQFLHKYMTYEKISSNRYDIFRNGLVHHGLPKSENGGVGPDEPHLHFLTSKKLNRVRGIHIHRNRECNVTLAVLLKEFEAGVRKFRYHEIKYNWLYGDSPDSSLPQATHAQ
jgi:hypothetical protein